MFIGSIYGQDVLRYYNSIDPAYGAARADLFRYLLIYKCGGVYLDIKSGLEQPLDEIIEPDDTYILSRWGGDDPKFRGWGFHPELFEDYGVGEFQQWHVIAAPGHPFLRAAIQRVLANIGMYIPAFHGVGAEGVIRTTGPVAYTRAIMPLLPAFPHRLVEAHSELGLVYSTLEDQRGHFTLFPRHYHNQTVPVVRPGWSRQVLSRTFEMGRTVRGWAGSSGRAFAGLP